MKQETIIAIESVAKADPEASPEQIKALLIACKTPFVRCKLINAAEAMRILLVSRPTLRKYVRMGKISEIRLSTRKTRFSLEEVERFAYMGSEVNKNA